MAGLLANYIAPPDYDSMTQDQLLRLRNSLPDNDPRQAMLAPYEHQAFAREYTADNPILGTLGLSVAIPAYAAAKALGLQHARTRPSIAAVLAGYRGIGQGLTGAVRRL